MAGAVAPAAFFVQSLRPAIVLFGDSLTERGFDPASGWAAAMAHHYARKVRAVCSVSPSRTIGGITGSGVVWVARAWWCVREGETDALSC